MPPRKSLEVFNVFRHISRNLLVLKISLALDSPGK